MRLNGYSAVLNVILFILFQQAVDAKNCARPRIANGRAKVRARGKMVYYRCRKKFTRVGAKFAVCLSQGVWSQPPPICIGKGCPNVTPTNGLQIIGEYNGAMLKFSCPAGMKRKGPESIYCNGQTWNVEPPTCVVGISLECDFEDEELCGWGQSDDDHFEWTWLSGATPTINTGPLHDHTFGNNSKKGHYLFIESSAPRKPFDKAILNSPLYQAQYSNSCFEFWYHMQGPDDENAVGSLEVFVKPESKLLDDIDPEFYMDGNQGPEWKRGSITIEQQTEVFQIIIIATRKDAFVSDIAIDDVRMYNCSEDDSASLTTDEITSEAVPTTMTTATSKIITPKTSILASTFKQSTQTTTVTKPKTTTPKTKPTTATLPTTTTTLPTTTTTLSTTTTTLPTTITTIPTTTTSTTLPTTTTTLPTTTTVTRKTTRKSSTTTKPKTRKRTTTQDRTTQTRSTTARTSTKQPETSTKPDSQTTVPLTLSTNKMSKSTIMSNAPTTLKRARHATTTISTAKESPTFRNNSFAGNSQDLSEAGSGNIDDVIGGDNNISSTSNRSQNIPPGSPIKEKTKDSLMPLIIGISCGVVVGLVVIGVAVYLWAKRQQNKTTEESEEEMAPIACAEGGYYNPS